jgi:DNA polymerase bacteriophage-type
MSELFTDIETYSSIDIGCGLDNYKSGAELLMLQYAIGDAPVRVVDVANGEPVPREFKEAYQDPSVVKIAHNASFEITLLNTLGFPTPIEQWQCSMARALSHALPPDLDTLGKVLGLPEEQQKIAEGKRLIRLFCQPQPANRKVQRPTKATHPEEWARFCEYGRIDVEALRAVWRRLPSWNWRPEDIALWHLDQRINSRGFAADVELAAAGSRAAATEKARLADRFSELTGGLKPTQRAQVQKHLNSRFDLTLTSTAKPFVEPLTKCKDPELREIASIILDANKTSTAKYPAVAQRIAPDRRLRGALQFAGAGRTRRWAGRGAQFQNLPSRGLPPASEIELYIDLLKAGAPVELFFNNLMLLGAASLRGLVVAPPGKKLVCADLSNIEGRMLAWVSDEQWKLRAFRDYDTILGYDAKGDAIRKGPDLYNITANMIIGVDPWKVEKKDRNVFGKVPDLASGYQGGVAGYQTFAKAYGVRMADHWDTIKTCVPPEHITKARENSQKEWAKKQVVDLEISELEWLASESCKVAWRAKHPATVAFWYALQDAAKNAIRNVGATFKVGQHIAVGCRKHAGHLWLLIKLPSGNFITYFEPSLIDDSIVYWGMASEEGSTTRAWVQCFTHGGKLTGNVCQTTARDLLAYNMAAIEAAGYQIVLTVHDEVICEAPDTPEYSEARLSALLATSPPWATGLPLASAGFEAQRYKKE